jgi:hypothetical protein
MAGTTNKVVSWVLQAVCYAAFVAVVGYFATSPPYVHLPAGEALVKLSFQHAGARKEACHERTPEELAKLAPNMRAASVCPRERVPLEVEIELDGRKLFATTLPPGGFSRDGAATIYRRIAVPAGSHRVVAKMKDTPAPGFGHVAERTVDLAPGRVLVIDFDAKEGGWVFRG